MKNPFVVRHYFYTMKWTLVENVQDLGSSPWCRLVLAQMSEVLLLTLLHHVKYVCGGYKPWFD